MFFKKKESYSPFLEFPFEVVHYVDLNVWATHIELGEQIDTDRMSGWF